ncbi:MAG: SDR family oxidoreductase, partial [Gammaproteobacteria bacterium]|nr:SDR family oxidoreductase [Gammaproteobacteria bacterium]
MAEWGGPLEIIKKVLVTGHRGYIGAVLLPKLLAEGYQVSGIDCGYYEGSFYLGQIAAVDEQIKDIRELTEAGLTGFDAVIHLAGLSNDPLGDFRPELTDEINYQATKHLAQLAKAAGVKRFIFASSCSVYGASDDTLLDEEASFNPVTPYAVSKARSETMLTAMADESFSPTFLRASTVYGLSPQIRFDLVINNLAAWAFATGKVQLKSDGLAWRPVVHVEDIADAYLAVLHADVASTHCEAFNVGSTSQNYTVLELAEMVRNGIENVELAAAKKPNHDKRCYRVSCDKIHRVLPHYQVMWSVPQGIAQLYQAFQEKPVSVEDFEGPRYCRIAHIKDLIKKGELDDSLRWVV